MFLLKNLGLRILAVISAMLFWVFIIGLRNPVYLFPEALLIQAFNVPEQMSIANDLGTVQLTVTADQDIARKLTKEDFEVYVDLKGQSEGEHQIDVSVTSKNPAAIVIRAEPKTVRVMLEKKQTKELPLRLELKGRGAEGYSLKSVTFSPSTVKVTGASSVIEPMKEFPVYYILQGSEKDFVTAEILLDFPNGMISPENVSMKLELQGKLEKKIVSIKVRTVDASGAPEKHITVTPQNIEIQGVKEDLADIIFVETETVDLRKTKSGTVKVKLNLPSGIVVAPGFPKEVTVKIQ